jgi:hypothetical protein
MAIVRWLLIAIASTGVMIVVERFTRRLLPLAALFSLTLAFPDRAPSRFRLAIRTATTLQLRKVIADARAGQIGSTPAEAAHKLLELVGALSLHDRLTRGHCERVRGYAHVIGEELGLDAGDLDRLRWSAMLHDIGELLVSADVLNKPGALTPAELEVVKQHPDFGRELVGPLEDWLGDAGRAVWEHHERWDGHGYPRRLAGHDISLAARIVAVADAFDVMTASQSYKQPVAAAAARAELARCSGTQFDPTVVRAFMNISIGRLRMAIGPLSWLTQLSFVPQSLVTAGASGTSAVTAVTAVIGLGAGTLGVGLSDHGTISAADSRSAAIGVVNHDDAAGSPSATTSTSVVPSPTSANVPATIAPPATAVITVATAAPTTTTTVVTTEVTPAAEVPPAESTTPPSKEPPAEPPVPAEPETTDPPATTTTTAIVPVDTTPEPASTTTVVTIATTTTVPVVPVVGDTTMFLTSPGSGDAVSQAVLPLTTGDVVDASVANYDTDRNGDPGLTLFRGSSQRFRWDVTQAGRLQGAAAVVLHATGKYHHGEFLLDAWLSLCRGDTCETIGSARAQGETPADGWDELTFELGLIDVELASGDALELKVEVPGESEHHVWLAYDSLQTPSRFTFDSAG